MISNSPSAGPAAQAKRKWPWYRPVIRNWRRYYLRQFPRKKTLRGGLLHRLLGNRLFDPGLWLPTRDTVAWGVAIGVFVGLMPFFGLQIVLSLTLCFLFRVNVTAAVVATFISNPLTTPGIIYLQVLVGKMLSSPMDPAELENYQGALRFVLSNGKPLMIGALVTGAAGALITYPLTMFLWTGVTKIGSKAIAAHQAKKHHLVKSTDTNPDSAASGEGPGVPDTPEKD